MKEGVQTTYTGCGFAWFGLQRLRHLRQVGHHGRGLGRGLSVMPSCRHHVSAATTIIQCKTHMMVNEEKDANIF
jgi:hypothetical protein